MEAKGVLIRSGVLSVYKRWLETATPQQIVYVDQIYRLCEQNYTRGGDIVVETMDPPEILNSFQTIQQVKEYVGLKVEQELNARWGEDDDPQLKRAKEFEEWQD